MQFCGLSYLQYMNAWNHYILKIFFLCQSKCHVSFIFEKKFTDNSIRELFYPSYKGVLFLSWKLDFSMVFQWKYTMELSFQWNSPQMWRLYTLEMYIQSKGIHSDNMNYVPFSSFATCLPSPHRLHVPNQASHRPHMNMFIRLDRNLHPPGSVIIPTTAQEYVLQWAHLISPQSHVIVLKCLEELSQSCLCSCLKDFMWFYY